MDKEKEKEKVGEGDSTGVERNVKCIYIEYTPF